MITAQFYQTLCRAVLTIALAASVASCSSHSDSVQRLVDELNSPAFRTKETSTGLYTDSSAKVEGDTLVLTFECAPFIDLSTVTAEKLPNLHAETLHEFRANLSNEKFKDGITTLNDDDKGILLVWNDAKGHSVRIAVSPAEILE